MLASIEKTVTTNKIMRSTRHIVDAYDLKSRAQAHSNLKFYDSNDLMLLVKKIFLCPMIDTWDLGLCPRDLAISCVVDRIWFFRRNYFVCVEEKHSECVSPLRLRLTSESRSYREDFFAKIRILRKKISDVAGTEMSNLLY